jgi:Leishmanolysin
MKYEIESYTAREGAEAKGTLPAAQSPFTIEVRFLGGLTQSQKNAFRTAADRWTRVIVGDLPAFEVDGEIIDDLLILAQGAVIDGAGGILGQAGPTRIRPQSAGSLPAKGKMVFDSADLAQMEQRGTLVDVITHEMGHVLGIGTLWQLKGLIAGSGTNAPTFTGANAAREYGVLTGNGAEPVPVENDGGPGTREGHWDEETFRNELMSGFVSATNNPLSRMTVASLQDLGYVVNLDAAEPYELPLAAVTNAEAEAEPPLDLVNAMIPVIPIELSDDSAR